MTLFPLAGSPCEEYPLMSRSARRLAASVVALATGAALAGGAHATPTGPTPTDRAKQAGITQPGQARMGWRTEDTRVSSQAAATPSGTPGIDVSSWQGSVDWQAQRRAGKKFAYVKASEGTTYTSPTFASQYNGAYNAGLIRGAYHFALPDSSSGGTQAAHFLASGGRWSNDGKTLPGVLDMEWNPYGATCYGKTKGEMRHWMKSFLAHYKNRVGRYPVIYTNTNWWSQCVGYDYSFGSKSPLWIARYGSSRGSLPPGWNTHTFWQYTDTPIDQNVFNGPYYRLYWFAKV